MRVNVLVFAVLLAMPGVAAAQEWEEYVSLQDGFRLNFPGQPRVTTTTWTSQLNYPLPARVYSAEKSRERYSLTVVDYSSIEQQGIERGKTCPEGNANCRANAPPPLAPGTPTTTSGGDRVRDLQASAARREAELHGVGMAGPGKDISCS
jgi:hypothetical protein